MCEALAALQLGFLSRQVRNCQETMWGSPTPAVPSVTPILKQADRALHGLSSRMNGYQRSTVVELWRRLDNAQSIPPHRLLECGPAAARIFKSRQQELWDDLRGLLAAIIAGEPRLVAWFAIGDHLADIAWQAYEGRVPVPLPPECWGHIYSSVDRLSERERRIVHPFFPKEYYGPLHLACQLIGTYRGLCGLLQSVGDNITAKPKWNGTTISYRGRQRTIKTQYNSVIVPILDECERCSWPETVTVPSGLENVAVKQAVYYFNKLGVIRLFLRGNKISW
jgi:hypothetical protein